MQELISLEDIATIHAELIFAVKILTFLEIVP